MGGGGGHAGRRSRELEDDSLGVALAELRYASRVRERVNALTLERLVGEDPQRGRIKQVEQDLAGTV